MMVALHNIWAGLSSSLHRPVAIAIQTLALFFALFALAFAQQNSAQAQPQNQAQASGEEKSSAASAPNAQINCQCAGLGQWSESCGQHQSSLLSLSAANEGKLLGYCRWQGEGAQPSTLQRLPMSAASSLSAADLEDELKSRFWSMEQDFNSASGFMQAGQHASAASTAKRVDKQSRVVAAQVARLLVHYVQSEQADLAETLLAKFESAISQHEATLSQWVDSSPAKFAKRFRRYGANQAELMALFYQQRNMYIEAAGAWQRAAKTATALMEASSKPRFWLFYRALAGSRWSQAAVSFSKQGRGAAADSAAAEAERLWSLAPPA